jgi:hypothetical protein
MRFFRRKPHEATIIRIAEVGPGAYLAMCSCEVASPEETEQEARVWASSHGAVVVGEVRDETGREGGAGWLCVFCGKEIERAPLRVMVHWTDDGVDDEQWYCAHRRCFVEHMSRDEVFAPNFSAE